MNSQLRNQSGQSMVEYLLVTAIIVLAVMFVFGLLQQKEYIFGQITKPVVAYLKYNYKYADKDALGWDESSGPKKHIQIGEPNPAGSFRLFLPDDRSR